MDLKIVGSNVEHMSDNQVLVRGNIEQGGIVNKLPDSH